MAEEIKTTEGEVIAPSANDRKRFIDELRKQFKAGKAHLSFSSAKHFRKAPSAFITAKMNKTDPTDAMKRGNVVDSLVLTPNLTAKKYKSDEKLCAALVEKRKAKSPRGTGFYKAWKARAERDGAVIVSGKMFDQAINMSQAVLTNEAAMIRLNNCPRRQEKVDFIHEGLRWIGYMDAAGDDEKIDLKCMASADVKDVMRDIAKMEYWLQAAIYIASDGEPVPYYIIAVDPACNVTVVLIDEDFILWALEQFSKLCREFNVCLKSNDFHRSYDYRAVHPEGFHIMNKPPYLT